MPPNEDENTDNEHNSQIQRPEKLYIEVNKCSAERSLPIAKYKCRTIGRKHDPCKMIKMTHYWPKTLSLQNDQDDALLAENPILAK